MLNFFKLRDTISGLLWGKIIGFFLKQRGKHIRIIKPLKLINLGRISIGDRVNINSGAWLQAHDNEAELKIGSGSNLGHFNHIYSYKSNEIGSNVLTADKVYISDCLHGYEDVHAPIMFQEIKTLNPVSIGDNCWLGENVVVLGVKIGKNCVIGANSVVTKDIPDFSVAVGSPARVIKKYNIISKTWEKV